MANKLAFLFPGQASQEVGMGQAMAEAYPAAANLFAQADQILDKPLTQLCWEGPEETLNQTENTQPALLTVSVACLAALREAGYSQTPDFVAGHSMGEYSAYVAAGVLSFEDGLKLVQERGRLMKKADEINPGKMAVIIKLEDEEVAAICAEASAQSAWVQVTNYNCPGQVVISGYEVGIDKAISLAQEAGARMARKLPISIAAHSKLMAVVHDEFKAAVDAVTLSKPKVPIIANNTAQPLTSIEAIRTEMVEQLTSPLLWTASVQYMLSRGVNQALEIGSKNVLAGFNKRIDRKGLSTINVEDPSGILKLMEAVS